MPETTVRLDLRYAGLCRHPEGMVVRGAPWRPADFPALFAVVRHPTHGITLFDTGYSERFAAETHPFPARLYRWLTPVALAPGETAVEQLRAESVRPEDVRRIVISHFHADHVAGLRDFPNAEFIATREALAAVQGHGTLKTLLKGFLPGLLPDDFADRARLLERSAFTDALGPFAAHDLFGDGAVQLVSLPGHAAGQVGLLVRGETKRVLLAADAAWTTASFRERRPPMRIADLIAQAPRTAEQTLMALHALSIADPELDIVPSHCRERARGCVSMPAAASPATRSAALR